MNLNALTRDHVNNFRDPVHLFARLEILAGIYPGPNAG